MGLLPNLQEHSFGPVVYPSSMTQCRAHTERITCAVLGGHAMTGGRANTKMALAVRVCCCAYIKPVPFPFFPWVGRFFVKLNVPGPP